MTTNSGLNDDNRVDSLFKEGQRKKGRKGVSKMGDEFILPLHKHHKDVFLPVGSPITSVLQPQ